VIAQRKDRQPNETQIRIDLHESAFVVGEDWILLEGICLLDVQKIG
jgi:hypothetical protein